MTSVVVLRISGLDAVLPRLARHLPGRRAARRSLDSIDRQTSAAQLVELAGICPFGAIALNGDALARSGESYQQARASLLQASDCRDAIDRVLHRRTRPKTDAINRVPTAHSDVSPEDRHPFRISS